MKIYVLGSKGMLGRYVSSYLKKKYEIIEITRNDLDVNIYINEIITQISNLGIKSDDVVINCIGTIKPMIDKLGDLNAIIVNSVFPRVLSNICESIGCKLIHPTTDCVFSGSKGSYTEIDPHDVVDVYGRTKSLGEPNNCTVIRTSIIGEELENGRSLVEWIKSNNGKTINGFTNHHWNGMTCLEFAKTCEKIINSNFYWSGVRHLFSNTVNKFELTNLIVNTYNLNILVNPIETEKSIDRTLSTTIINDNIVIPDLNQQINEMRDFNKFL